MTFAWTPHQDYENVFSCETGDDRTVASIMLDEDVWRVLITIETNDEYIHLKTLRPTKLQAMAAIEVTLNDLLPLEL